MDSNEKLKLAGMLADLTTEQLTEVIAISDALRARSAQQAPSEPKKRRGGRPKGSRNKKPQELISALQSTSDNGPRPEPIVQ